MSTILIAEDSAVNRELLRELIEARGHKVIEACNGVEALDSITADAPDILLLDIGMPILDGFATIRRIRENSILRTLAVLAITAYAMRGDRERVLDAGFDGYLSKPVDPTLLYGELDRWLVPSSRRVLATANGAL